MNRFWAFSEWIFASVMPPPLRVRIPGSSGQGFRFDPATHSNLIRPPIPGHPATLSG